MKSAIPKVYLIWKVEETMFESKKVRLGLYLLILLPVIIATLSFLPLISFVGILIIIFLLIEEEKKEASQ